MVCAGRRTVAAQRTVNVCGVNAASPTSNGRLIGTRARNNRSRLACDNRERQDSTKQIEFDAALLLRLPHLLLHIPRLYFSNRSIPLLNFILSSFIASLPGAPLLATFFLFHTVLPHRRIANHRYIMDNHAENAVCLTCQQQRTPSLRTDLLSRPALSRVADPSSRKSLACTQSKARHALRVH